MYLLIQRIPGFDEKFFMTRDKNSPKIREKHPLGEKTDSLIPGIITLQEFKPRNTINPGRVIN